MGAVMQTSEWLSLLFPVLQAKRFLFLEAPLLPRMETTKYAVYITNPEGTDSKSLSCQAREEKKLKAPHYLSGEVTGRLSRVGRLHHKEHDTSSGFSAASKNL